MKKFKLKSVYKPIKEQNKAIDNLCNGVKSNQDYQVLLGVTGSGKTFTIANVIKKLQMPALIISHNKTLAAQLYQEFRDYFPQNCVSYFVSYYDYYQPESYIPSTDTYIEKDSDINELIDKLRLSTTTNLLTRNDNIVVASVSCIYNIGSPKDYGSFIFEFTVGVPIKREQIIQRLVGLQYERADFGFIRGSFRVRGNILDIYPSYMDDSVRITTEENKISDISLFNPTTGEVKNTLGNFVLYPSKHYITDPTKHIETLAKIKSDMNLQYRYFMRKDKLLEAERIKKRVSYDLEMINEVGYVKGIENYSRYFDGRQPGEPPFSLLDYFKESFSDNWLVIIDESHITFPQIRGMYMGDLSRKKTLIDYGFRLPAALDNRPLRFDEFLRRIPNFIATSATPGDWEISMAKKAGVVEQLLRPTGIPDPKISIKPVDNEVSDVVEEIKKRSKKGQRTLVTTLTKKQAEDLAQYLKKLNIKVHYLHSDVKTLQRSDILDNLRKGIFDCIVGVNLLREGLDLPEVTLVAILDADKEGFLRSRVSLIQTMGRAARHVEGEVILYADTITKSIKNAIEEVARRREYQLKMNKKLGIKPKSVEKPIREKLIDLSDIPDYLKNKSLEPTYQSIKDISLSDLTPFDRKKLLTKLKKEMKIAAQDLNFELAAEIRDKINEFEN